MAVVAAFVIGATLALTGRDDVPVMTTFEREQAQAGLDKLMREAEAIRKDAAARVRKEFRLVVTDAELNVLLTDDEDVRSRLVAHGIESAHIRIADKQVTATMMRSMSGLSVQVKATMVPEIKSERTVVVRIVSLSVGRFSVPRPAAQRLADEVGRLLSSRVSDPHIYLESVEVVGDHIELTGATR